MTAAVETTGSGGFRDALRHREFRLLLASYGVSWTGDWCYSVALTIWVVQRTGSGTWVAALLGHPHPSVRAVRRHRWRDRRPARPAPAHGGPRRRPRALLMVPLVVVVATDAPVVLGGRDHVRRRRAERGVPPGGGRRRPRTSSARRTSRPRTRSSRSSTRSRCSSGPALASLLLQVGSAEFAFVFNGVTFLVSAVLVAGVRSAGGAGDRTRATRRPGGRTPTTPSDAPSGIRAELAERHARRSGASPGSRRTRSCSSARSSAYGAEEVLKVLVTTDNLGTGPEALGLLGAAMGVGGLVVAPFTARPHGARAPRVALRGQPRASPA